MVRSLEGKHPKYYESVLQLRNVKEEVLKFVQEQIHKKNIPCPKIKKLKTGHDFYLADSQFTKSLGKKLQQTFGGKIHITASLWGVRKDKEVYRTTILFRGMNFKKGDVINYQGEKYRVRSLGKDILLQEIKTGKKVHLKYTKIKRQVS